MTDPDHESPPASADEVDIGSQPPSSDDIRSLALAMTELSTSLHEMVGYLKSNPELTQLPDTLRDLSKRISVLSTRL